MKYEHKQLPQKEEMQGEKNACSQSTVHFHFIHTHTQKFCNEYEMYYFHSIATLCNFTLYESNH